MVYAFNSVYALTLGKKRIVAFFSTICLAQLTIGMYVIGVSVNKQGTQ